MPLSAELATRGAEWRRRGASGGSQAGAGGLRLNVCGRERRPRNAQYGASGSRRGAVRARAGRAEGALGGRLLVRALRLAARAELPSSVRAGATRFKWKIHAALV